ncbi:hypothetical protein E8A74_06485 [Polyangium fumosum]|uniref:Uncharacterized protein n=1 Tax=Polyangium fumosum TaxID=889272 RepID=A0A4U1JHB5_9BACT|nr:hypothetical protein E8A74_06485 [Polyangium fumosum]
MSGPPSPPLPPLPTRMSPPSPPEPPLELPPLPLPPLPPCPAGVALQAIKPRIATLREAKRSGRRSMCGTINKLRRMISTLRTFTIRSANRSSLRRIASGSRDESARKFHMDRSSWPRR